MSIKIPILSIYDADGNQIEIPALPGKSAYRYAVDGGYTGTEEEFSELLANIPGASYIISEAVGTTFPPAQKPAASDISGYDIDVLNATADDIHAYIDTVVSGKNIVTKEILGKDASGKYDIARYTYANREYCAWARKNYPKMYAWKNGDTVMYTKSVSPRIGEKAHSTPYVGTTTQGGETTPNFTNVKDQCTYKYGYRYSLSSAEYKVLEGTTTVIVPVSSGSTSVVIRFKGISPNLSYTGVYGGISAESLTESCTPEEFTDGVHWSDPDGNGVYTATCPKSASTTYISFHMIAASESDFSDFVVTVNEPIEYTTTNGETVESGTPITAVSAANRSRTIDSVEYVRYEDGDVEPTVIYTDKDDDRNSGTEITQDTIVYTRYPLGDLGANRSKLTPVFIYANEHGISPAKLDAGTYEPKMCALVAARLLCDLADDKQAGNPIYKYIREHCMLIVIPVANPFGYNLNVSGDTPAYSWTADGYYNYNGCNINRNYDTPGWDVMLAGGESSVIMGTYPGSQNETQYIMNTMVESGAVVAMSLHGLGAWEGYCAHQGQSPDGTDYNRDKLERVNAFLHSNYGYTLRYYDLNADGTPAVAVNTPDITSKSPSYITQCGAYGGIVEMSPDDVNTSGWKQEMKSNVIENAYAQTLNLMAMWLSDYLEDRT